MHVCEPHPCPVPREASKRQWVPGDGVTESYEPPCMCWESNPGPLKSSQCSPTEPSLQLHVFICEFNEK